MNIPNIPVEMAYDTPKIAYDIHGMAYDIHGMAYDTLAAMLSWGSVPAAVNVPA